MKLSTYLSVSYFTFDKSDVLIVSVWSSIVHCWQMPDVIESVMKLLTGRHAAAIQSICFFFDVLTFTTSPIISICRSVLPSSTDQWHNCSALSLTQVLISSCYNPRLLFTWRFHCIRQPWV